MGVFEEKLVTCNTCEEAKPESEYPTHLGKRSGKRCKACRRAYTAAHYAANQEYKREQTRSRRHRAKVEALAQYGGHCAVCNETRHQFLCLDHVDNDGAVHRGSRAFNVLKIGRAHV